MKEKISLGIFDAVVVGAGAAGLSAALVLGRARRRVLLCDAGPQRNAVADEMHGFLSRDGTPPLELLAEASNQLLRYPTVEIYRKSVMQIRRDMDGFIVTFDDKNVSSRRVILATGMMEELPSIPGLRERWGHSVFSCPYCDGWEIRDRPIAIAGDGKDLVPLAQELYQWSKRITICGLDSSACSSDERAWLSATGTRFTTSAIAALEGDRTLTVRQQNGETFSCDALFICVPLVQRSRLVSDLGCATTRSGRIEVSAERQTSVWGIYAAGDASEPIHQVVTAAAGGAVAGISVNNDLCAEDVRTVLAGSAARGDDP